MAYICDCGQNYTDATGIEACQMNNHGQPLPSSPAGYMPDWKRFGKEPLHGVFWACGRYPEYDIDCDDLGQTIGVPTGKAIKFVALVEIDFEPGPDGEYEINPVNEYATGAFDAAEYGITHYAKFEVPKGI